MKNWDNHPLLGGFWSGPPHSDPKVSSPKFHQLLQLPVNWSPSPWTRLYSVFLWRSAPCVYFMGKIHPAPSETSKNLKTKLSFFRYRILWRSVWPPWTEWYLWLNKNKTDVIENFQIENLDGFEPSAYFKCWKWVKSAPQSVTDGCIFTPIPNVFQKHILYFRTVLYIYD